MTNIKEGRSDDRPIGELIELRFDPEGGFEIKLQSHTIKGGSANLEKSMIDNYRESPEGRILWLLHQYDIPKDERRDLRKKFEADILQKYRGSYSGINDEFREGSGEEFKKMINEVHEMYQGFLSILQSYVDESVKNMKSDADPKIESLKAYLDKNYPKAQKIESRKKFSDII